MPVTKKEQIIFGLIMATIMVYGMIVYNIAIEFGGMSNQVFEIALHELIIMAPIAFILEAAIVGKLAFKLAFKVVTESDRDIFKIFAIQIAIVLIMCPIMSLIATLLFANPGNQIISVWLQKYALNLPFALGWQLVICGPLVRAILKLIRQVDSSKQAKESLA